MEYKLRPWTIDDLESLVENANNYHIAKFMTDDFPFPYTREDGEHFINFIAKYGDNTDFAIEINRRAVGGIGIHPQKGIMKKNAELGYWLGEKYWGHGIITRAIKEVVDFAFGNFDITRLYARPFGTNTASQRVLEKNGFKLEAKIEKGFFKNREYVDELIYAIRR
jgi:RimJ/RimL family protein N-acetyltransferase